MVSVLGASLVSGWGFQTVVPGSFLSCRGDLCDSIPCFGPGVAPGSFFLWGVCSVSLRRFSQWPPLCWFVVLLWQSCMSYHPLPLWITRSNFPWVLMALLVLLMTSAMIWHLYPHPTRWLVLMVTKFLRSLIPIQVWCWALLFPSHDGAW